MDADPEDVPHDMVGVGEVADLPFSDAQVGGLAKQIAGEQQSGADLLRFQMAHKRIASERRVGADSEGQGKTAEGPGAIHAEVGA